ncbi:MAG: MFS transporter, partial [Acetobacteraceae bacterium]
MAIVSLVPFIVVSTAYVMFSAEVRADLHASRLDAEIVAGPAIAGYAFGALSGGDLVQRFRQRHLFLVCEAMFTAGSMISAASHGLAHRHARRDDRRRRFRRFPRIG